MEAIPTTYNGIEFRSRLEARWAVFFDALGIKYEYEPEKFDLGDFRYIPDFRLIELGMWVEIKHETKEDVDSEPPGLVYYDWTDREFSEEKALRLAALVKEPVYILSGPPWNPNENPNGYTAYVYYPDYSFNLAYWWAECPVCGRFGIEFNGQVDQMRCRCVSEGTPGDKSERLLAAYETARRMRFDAKPGK